MTVSYYLRTKAFGVLLCAGVMIMQPSCIRNSYEVKISGPITISEQWIELEPKSPLKVDQDLQMVVLELEAPFKYDFYEEGRGANKGQGILMPDGEVINPEIEIVDSSGQKFSLVYSGARQTFSPVYDLPYPNKWPPHAEYKSIRIRSDRPIKCKAIYWLCESSKDWK
jgi:hypothetical protein